MAEAKNQLDQSLEQTFALQNFLYALGGRLEADKLKPGQDLTPMVKEFGLEVPALLRGEAIIWEGHTTPHHAAQGPNAAVFSFVRPGHADIVGIVLGCITIRNWHICLECGWFWCRIVISTTFLL